MNRIQIISVCAALAASAATVQAAADPKKGKSVFDGNNCGACHNAASTEKKMGPGLKGLYKRDKLTNGKKPSDATVRAKVEEGGGGMPGYKSMLSEQEKNDLLAYLKTL